MLFSLITLNKTLRAHNFQLQNIGLFYTYTQSCLSNLFRISLSRNSSQHCTAVWNILPLQFNAAIRNEFTESPSAVSEPQWYNNDCTSRRTSPLNGESDVPVRHVSMVDAKQISSLLYSCLTWKRKANNFGAVIFQNEFIST